MSDQEIKDFLYDEVLVDCNGEEEEYTSWLYYADDELQFPFNAKIKLKKVGGKLENKKVEILRLANNNSNFGRLFDLKVEVEIGEYLMEIPLSKLNNIEDLGRNQQIIEVWKYWSKH